MREQRGERERGRKRREEREGRGERMASGMVTFSMESKAVTMPSTTGNPPFVSTGEWRPLALVTAALATVVVAALPSATNHTCSPTPTSLAFLRIVQHEAPTGR